MSLKPSMGALHLQQGEQKFRLSRYTPSGEAGFFIKHFWIVQWDLREQEPHWQDVIPNPCVNLVIERNRSYFYPPAKSKYSKLLEGQGCVVGAKFKPGAFYPFIRQPVSELTNPMEAGHVLDVDARTLEESVLSQTDEKRMAELAESFISPKLPEKDEQIVRINEIVDAIAGDREITKVDDVCSRFHINKRTLQRLFEQYVGVAPKWVIRLYRLQNAAEMIERGQYSDWLKLSLDLGYYDQAHFTKDFKAVVGRTPDEYARQHELFRKDEADAE